MTTQLTAANVANTFTACLFQQSEPTDNHVPVDGVTMRVGFHPERIEAQRASIAGMLRQLRLDFLPADAGGGGGASFMLMAVDRDGNLWGQHQQCEQLLLLASALGFAEIPFPRETWSALPGGLPYIVFKPATA